MKVYKKMSNEEQRVQHETISAIDSKVENIERKSYQITRGQIVTWGLILLSAGFSANKITSNVATKSDIQRLEAKVNDLNGIMTNYAQSNEDVHIKLHASVAANRHSIDSLGKVEQVRQSGYMTQYKRRDGSIGWRDLD